MLQVIEVELCISHFPGILYIIAISETWPTVNKKGIILLVVEYRHSFTRTAKVILNAVMPDLNYLIVVAIPFINNTVADQYRRPRGNIDTFLEEIEFHCPQK